MRWRQKSRTFAMPPRLGGDWDLDADARRTSGEFAAIRARYAGPS